MRNTKVTPAEINPLLEQWGTTKVEGSISLMELLKRPQVSYEKIAEADKSRPELPQHIVDHLEVKIKYEGYIRKQLQQIEKFKRLEDKKLSENIDYSMIEGLRIEAKEKLEKFRPLSIGQASRISGVSPADINVLLIYLEKHRRRNNGASN